MVLGALAVGAQAFSSTPTTTTGGLPPCGTIDDNGLNCQGLKSASAGGCYFDIGYSYWSHGTDGCDCAKHCCSKEDYRAGNNDVFKNGECDTTLTGN